MTTADQELRIRLPWWARAWIGVFLPVWLWLLFAQIDIPGPFSWLMAAFGLGIGARMFVMGAVGTADGRLTVRNQFTTRTFRREELTDAVVERASRGLVTGWTVWLLLRDGRRHHVQLTEAPFRRGFTRILDRQAAELRQWIRAPGSGPPLT